MAGASVFDPAPRRLRPRVDRLRLGAGLTLDIRPLTTADAGALQAHVRGLSARSRHNRYLGGVNELPRTEVDRLLSGVGGTVFPLVAELVGVSDGRMMVGEAVFAVDRDAMTAEFALSVADAWQGRGIGAALLDSIACRAAEVGGRLLHGETLQGNEAMLALAAKVGAAITRHRGDPRLVWMERDAAMPVAESPCARLAAREIALAA
jgi:GNAT superfamily N-acetyltransferase